MGHIPVRRREAHYLASIDPDPRAEPCGARLHHPPESSFGQFNRPVIMDDEIQVRVEAKAVDRRQDGSGHGPATYGPDGMRPSARHRNIAASAQLVGS
jgi:hypothetical protein